MKLKINKFLNCFSCCLLPFLLTYRTFSLKSLEKNKNFNENSIFLKTEYENSDLENESVDYFKFLSENAKNIALLISNENIEKNSVKFEFYNNLILKSDLKKEAKTNLADIIFLQYFINNSLIENSNNEMLKIIENCLNEFKKNEKEKYSYDVYRELGRESYEFSLLGQKTKSCIPENVIFINSYVKFKNSPVIYDETILLPLSDLFNIIGAQIEYMEDSPVIVAYTNDFGIFELEKGKKEIYKDDKEKTLDVPVLDVNGVTYVSCNSIFSICNYEIINLPNFNSIIII